MELKKRKKNDFKYCIDTAELSSLMAQFNTMKIESIDSMIIGYEALLYFLEVQKKIIRQGSHSHRNSL